jgi:16S rRNA (cytosine967-C5)-methyltransferase
VGKISRTPYAPDGLSLFNPKTSIPEIESFKDGWFQVQDEAAQLVSHLLNPQPGENILDACAGLGGKTGHIAQMMGNQGAVVAMDKDKRKLLQLKGEMKRLGVSMVTTKCYDLNTPPRKRDFPEFDRVLLDAPCSGLGVLRRNPDIKWTMSKKRLTLHQKKQGAFLNNLAHFVKPSGVLVFAVCSLEPEENEAVINDFLNKHSNFVIEDSILRLPFKARSFVDDNRCLRTLPHVHNMDGFFSVSLKRTQ